MINIMLGFRSNLKLVLNTISSNWQAQMFNTLWIQSNPHKATHSTINSDWIRCWIQSPAGPWPTPLPTLVSQEHLGAPKSRARYRDFGAPKCSWLLVSSTFTFFCHKDLGFEIQLETTHMDSLYISRSRLPISEVAAVSIIGCWFDIGRDYHQKSAQDSQ